MAGSGWLQADDSLLQGSRILFSDPGESAATNLNQTRVNVLSPEGAGEAPQKPDSFSLDGKAARSLAPLRPGSPILRSRAAREREDANERSLGLVTPEDAIESYIMQQVLKIPGFDPDGRHMELLGGQAHRKVLRQEDVTEPGSQSYLGSQRTDPDRSAATTLEFRGGLEGPEAALKPWTSDEWSQQRRGFSDLFQSRRTSDLASENLRTREAWELRQEEFRKIIGYSTPSFASVMEGMLNPQPAKASRAGGPDTRPTLFNPGEFNRPDPFNRLGQFDGPGQSDKPGQFNGVGQFNRPGQFDLFGSRGKSDSGVLSAPKAPRAPRSPFAPGQESLEPEQAYSPPVTPRQTFAVPSRSF
jgi:hypothetical protein